MRKKYIVKVFKNDEVIEVKTNVDNSSFKEMVKVYNDVKKEVENGYVKLISIEDGVEKTIYSKEISNKEKVDEVIDNLIENINWLIAYKENSNDIMSAIDMSRDVALKKIELHSNYSFNDDLESKEDIFDEIKEILTLRRKIKYSKLLVNTISDKINLEKIKEVLVNSRNNVKNKPSIDVRHNAIQILEQEPIKNIFNIEDIDKIKKIKNSNDKVLLLTNTITPINKNNTTIKDDNITNIIYEGKSYKKLGKNKVLLKYEKIGTYKKLSDEKKNNIIQSNCRKYNYIVNIGNDIYGYLYKPEYNGLAIAEIINSYNKDTIKRKSSIYKEVKIIDDKLYCLAEGI